MNMVKSLYKIKPYKSKQHKETCHQTDNFYFNKQIDYTVLLLKFCWNPLFGCIIHQKALLCGALTVYYRYLIAWTTSAGSPFGISGDCYWHWIWRCALSLSPIYFNGSPSYMPVIWGAVCLLQFNPKYYFINQTYYLILKV